MPFVDVHGIRTHHLIQAATGNAVTGEPPVVLLHGGFCSAAVMAPMARELGAHVVHAPERPGHGRTPDRPGPLSYADGVADTLGYLDAVGLPQAHLVGFSDGAILGLLLARDHPDRVRSLVSISANLTTGAWSEDERGPEDEAAGERWGVVLREEHDAATPEPAGHADDLLDRLSTLWRTQPDIEPASLAAVRAPVLVMAADRDVVALDHTRLIARSVPGAQLCVVPDTTHMLVRERPGLVGRVVAEFLAAP